MPRSFQALNPLLSLLVGDPSLPQIFTARKDARRSRWQSRTELPRQENSFLRRPALCPTDRWSGHSNPASPCVNVPPSDGRCAGNPAASSGHFLPGTWEAFPAYGRWTRPNFPPRHAAEPAKLHQTPTAQQPRQSCSDFGGALARQVGTNCYLICPQIKKLWRHQVNVTDPHGDKKIQLELLL